MVGVYKDGVKFDEITTDEHASEALIKILENLSSKFNITKIIYANTPGGFMGLKVAYVILKTFSLAKGCKFYAVSGFSLNGHQAIRANKNLSFVLKDGKISLEKVEPVGFRLPLNLDELKLNSDTLPDYIIQAV